MHLTKLAVSGLAALTVAALAAVAVAQDVVVDPAIASMTPDQKVAARQAAMKEDGGILKTAGSLTGADASAAADKLIQNFTNFPALFPADTNGVAGTEAKAEIWNNVDAFNAIFAKALEGSKAMKTAAEAGDAAAYGAALKTIGGTCGECHQQYRS